VIVRLYFVFTQPHPETWRDGLWAALQLLAEDFEVMPVNLATGETPPPEGDHILMAWGDFDSAPEAACRHLKARVKALQMGGMAMSSIPIDNYDVVFAETDWHRRSLAEVRGHKRVRHAFGVNTDIYYPHHPVMKLFDWITVGSWTYWKRQYLLTNKPGTKLAVGERYIDSNPEEAPVVVADHLRAGITVSPFVSPERLAQLYNASRACYIPAELLGGGERAVLEARACGLPVIVEQDNPKLIELAGGPILSHHDFAAALRAGFKEALDG
jgi:glycosyltransferase involved in cell wall biosynthesis